MSFLCTPAQLAAHIISALAVSDSLTLPQLWRVAESRSSGNPLDEFEKTVVWQSLMVQSGPLLIEIKAGSMPVALASCVTYQSLLVHGAELEIVVSATEECRFRYLTGTENFQATKAALGEFPFQLLVVVARHGCAGILNPELARESGQDARSLRIRLQKLEQAGLVVCKNVFVDKKHTTHTVHTRFTTDEIILGENEEDEEDLDATHDLIKLRKLVLDALERAPNNLRGFSDLRKELKLDGSISAIKFFRSVCRKLHHTGIVEKLTVELPGTKQRLYAIRLLNDAPKDTPADLDVDANDDPSGDEDLEELLLSLGPPLLNNIFPVYHQIFRRIHGSGDQGTTTAEVNKSLLGISEYKPFTKLYEALPSFLSNTKVLKSAKKYTDPYPRFAVSKLYENEGKLKFYKYYAEEFCKEEKPKYKPIPSRKPSKDSIVALTKKLHSSLGKTSKEALLEKKRRALDKASTSKKRSRSEDAESQVSIKEEGEELPRKREARRKPISYDLGDVGELMEVDNTNDADFLAPGEQSKPSSEQILGNAKSEVFTDSIEGNSQDDQKSSALSSRDLPKFVVVPKDSRQRKPQTQVYKTESSVKSITRRNYIIQLIRDQGGAVFSSYSLAKKVDVLMGNNTATDNKTFLRDIKELTNTKALMVKKIELSKGDQLVEKKLLVLADPKDAPSQKRINELKQRYAEPSKRDIKMFPKRLIQSDVKLYVEVARPATPPRANKKREKSHGSDGRRTIKNETNEDSTDLDVFSKIKKNRRARKITSSEPHDIGVTEGKKTRRNIRLEKSDATALYRCVVISKAFNRDAIDFAEISQFVSGLDGKLAKQKWGTLRRLYGGAEAVNKSVETFQGMVMVGIEDGIITEEHLASRSLEFFLEYWKKFDSSTEFGSQDDMPLYLSYQQNAAAYLVTEQSVDRGGLMSEKIEDSSMRQKETILSQTAIFQDEAATPDADPLDEIKSLLRAIFSTKEEEADQTLVKKILERHGEEKVQMAIRNMLRNRELLYVSLENNNTKFILSDSFNNTFIQRGFTPAFYSNAYAFRKKLQSVRSVNKGLLLSQGIMAGDMAALLEYISDDAVDILRVDRELKFENYESRLIDKEQISCDIIVTVVSDLIDSANVKPVVVPTTGPCAPVWVALNGHVATDIWKRLIMTLLYHVVFKPGVTIGKLWERTQAVLTIHELQQVMEWLTESGCVKRESLGYRATNVWHYILGG